MADMVGVEHVIAVAQDAVDLKPIGWEEGRFYAAVARDSDGESRVEVVDLDAYRATSAVAEHPVRKSGTTTVGDAESFVAYVKKHGDEHTEVWANETTRSVTAVLNAHQAGPDGPAGWGDHRVMLKLVMTPAWTLWNEHDGQWLTQTQFAELIEKRSIDISGTGGHYTAADMLELAQSFKATARSQFESSRRIKTGETQLVYLEETDATAGARGDLAIPDQFKIVLKPFVRGIAYAVYCRLRYRIDRSTKQLCLGYVIERPEDVITEAFNGYIDQICGLQDDGTISDTAGISQPVWWGSPAQ